MGDGLASPIDLFLLSLLEELPFPFRIDLPACFVLVLLLLRVAIVSSSSSVISSSSLSESLPIYIYGQIKYWWMYLQHVNWMVTETWFIFQYIPLGLPGGLRARIPLLATFMIGAKLHSCSPPNDFRNENSRFSPLPIFSFTLSPKSWILIRLSRKNDTFKSFLV